MQDFFSTTDTALAAYLSYLGFPITIRNSDFPTTYHFDDSQDLQMAIRNWESSTAMGNLRLYFNSYRSLLRRIKGAIQDDSRGAKVQDMSGDLPQDR